MGHQLGSPSDGFCHSECGKGKPEGTHFKHDGYPCTWHDGTCEEANLDESLWCPCGRDELAHKLWIEAHPNGKPVSSFHTLPTLKKESATNTGERE